MKKLSLGLKAVGVVLVVIGIILSISEVGGAGTALIIFGALAIAAGFGVTRLSKKSSSSSSSGRSSSSGSSGSSSHKTESGIIVYDTPEIVTLEGKNGNKIRMLCFALVPYMKKVYAVMKTKDRLEGVDPNGALIFLVTRDSNDDSPNFQLVDDDDIIDPVLYRYNNRK